MSEQPQRPTGDDPTAWGAYWQAQGMPWRTAPEIDEQRQRYLTARRAVQPDIERGIYPFRDEHGGIALTRADVEWLLATHESGGMRGPVDWSDAKQRGREGLDLRGADLRSADLRQLPLARLRGSLTWAEATDDLADQVRYAAVHCEQTDLRNADLSGAILRQASCAGADLRGAILLGTDLYTTDLRDAQMSRAMIAGATLRRVRFSATTSLYGLEMRKPGYDEPRFRDIQWNGVDLTVVDWSQLTLLGDERTARRRKRPHPLNDFRNAARAYRQLATVLRAQGLNEDADRFAYRAQRVQRHVYLLSGRVGRSTGFWLLDFVSGYGYKPMRSVIAYVVIICLFAGAYLLNAQFAAPHLTWDEALVLSISSFHGRGFFTTGVSLGDTLARLAAGEAIIGLLIEITFIATFTQRFFAR